MKRRGHGGQIVPERDISVIIRPGVCPVSELVDDEVLRGL